MANVLTRFSAVAAFAAASLALANPASATYMFDIGDGNSGLSSYTGPYAHGTVDLVDATHASINFSSLTSGTYIYLMGGAQAVDLNVNAALFSVSTPVGANSGNNFDPGDPYTVNIGAQNVSSFGSFNLTIDSFDGYQHSADSVSFTLTNLSGSWVNDAAVLDLNADNYFAAVHVFVSTNPGDGNNGLSDNPATGFAGTGTGTCTNCGGGGGGGPGLVPEPASMFFLGLGALGLGLIRRRRMIAG